MKEFLRTTIIGGALFLLPVAIILFILSYALRLVKRIAEPILDKLHLNQLGRIPQYQLMKSMAEGPAHLENASDLKPTLASIEGGWQIGYLLEQL
jgi:hypothetical protein